MVFLDTRVYIRDSHLVADVHMKDTDTHHYLHATSCHPLHCKTAIPFGQALRLKWICSSEESFDKRTKELVGHLSVSGYGKKIIEEDIRRAANIKRRMPTATAEERNRQNTICDHI